MGFFIVTNRRFVTIHILFKCRTEDAQPQLSFLVGHLLSIFLFTLNNMKNLWIRKAGRLGNFIKQLTNSIHIAVFYKYNIIIPTHKCFNTTYIKINNEVSEENEKIVDEHEFHYAWLVHDIDKKLFSKNNELVKEILRKLFSIKECTLLGSNDVLIHIRSGDIFRGTHVHNGYIQPPLSYYIDILEKKNLINYI